MKTMKRMLALALVAVMLLAMVSCDKSSAVKKAFEKAEYKVETLDAENENVKAILSLMLNEDQMKKVAEYEVIYVSMDGLVNVLKKAVIIKFPSAGDVKDFYTVEKDGKKDTSAYEKAEKDGWINGNCLILTASSDCLTVFKEA